MYSNRNNRNNNNRVAYVPKMRCKVCEDAKMPENVITSHFTKNKDGSVACPTLLNQECRYCYRRGHTVKYCKIKENKEANASEPVQQYKVFKPCAIIAPKLQTNAFALLDSDEETETVSKVAPAKVVEEFPALCAPKTQSTSNLSFKNALTTEPKPVAPQPVIKHVAFGADVPKAVSFVPRVKTCSWADAESSDEEDDEEEEEVKVEVVDNSAW
jgi:Nanos RNA binding domain